MSDERPVFARWRFPFAGMLGNKLLVFELFEAKHWRLRPGTYIWPGMYRIRVNGKWFGERKYSFFTLSEIADVAQHLLEQ